MDQPTHPMAEMIASRSQDLAMSAIKEMSILSAKVPGAASLAWGLPSFCTPASIRGAVARALETDPGIGMYALPGGLPELCVAAAQEHERRTGVRRDSQKHVTITAGNMEGLNTLFHVIVDPGDEVIVTDPGFVSHISQIRFNGGIPVFWKMREDMGWEPVFQYVRPEGAYYVFPRLIDASENAVEFSHRLLQEARVTVTPGAAFGPSGEHHVRMAYCVEDETINLAFDRMEAYFGR
jgi:aspartate/methionine/tyrosine aminotransferase